MGVCLIERGNGTNLRQCCEVGLYVCCFKKKLCLLVRFIYLKSMAIAATEMGGTYHKTPVSGVHFTVHTSHTTLYTLYCTLDTGHFLLYTPSNFFTPRCLQALSPSAGEEFERIHRQFLLRRPDEQRHHS